MKKPIILPRRFLFATTPGSGHFHPLVPLARALKARGHAVAFAAREFLQARVEAEGFLFFPVGSDREQDAEYQQFRAELGKMPTGLEYELFIYNRLFMGVMPRLYMPRMVEVVKGWEPHLIVREAAEYSAVMAGELMRVPHATVAFAAALNTMTVFERDGAARLDPIREAWGLPPDPKLSALYRNLYVSYAPPSFSTADAGIAGVGSLIPETMRSVRPDFFDRSGEEMLPEWFRGRQEQPVVYATMGTEVNNMPEFYPRVLETIIEGLRDLPIELIVTLGRDKDPADFGAQPPNVHIERYIPQSLLLPHCDAMVMHGGSNSLLAALDAGLPTVVIPLIADQFFNAKVTEHLGLGAVVREDALTAERVREATVQVLESKQFRERMGAMREEMHRLPGQETVVEWVELLSVGKSIDSDGNSI